MFCCCFPTLRGLSRGQKLSRNFQRRRLWPFGKRNPQRSTPVITEELSDWFCDDLSLHGVQERQATNTLHSCSQTVTQHVEVLADGFTYAISRYKVQPRRATNTGQNWTQSSSQDILQELFKGPGHSIYQVRVQVHQDPDTVSSWSENSTKDIVLQMVYGFNYSASLDWGKVHQATNTIQCRTEYEAEFTLHLTEACRMRALQQGTLEGLKKSTLQTLPGGSISRISTFTVLHPAFSRAQQALDQLLPRWDAIEVFSTSGGFFPYDNQGDTPTNQVTKAIASMVRTWPDRVQYCGQPLLLPWSKLKRALVQVDSPASHLVGHIHLLWLELEHVEPTEAELEESRTHHSLRNGLLWGHSLVLLCSCWSQRYL